MIKIPDFLKSNDLLMNELDQIIVLASMLDYKIKIKLYEKDYLDRCVIEISDYIGRRYELVLSYVRGIFHEFEFLEYGDSDMYGDDINRVIKILSDIKQKL